MWKSDPGVIILYRIVIPRSLFHCDNILYDTSSVVYRYTIGRTQFYSSTVLQFYSSTVLQFYSSTVLQFYSSTVLQFYSSTVLQFYSSTVLLLVEGW